jgi:sigma-B regulation protein RsbU (phosphoserine phosphatase)
MPTVSSVKVRWPGSTPRLYAGRQSQAGMFREAEFSATRLQLEDGDTLFLYTDGLSEACSAEDEYGVDRITQLVRQQAGRHPNELIAACLSDLNAFADLRLHSDDLTLLAIQRRG